MKRRIAAFLLSLALLTAGVAAPVAAHDGGTDIGASGNCSEGERGGGASVGVNTDGSVDPVNAFTVLSIALGVGYFAEQKAANPEREDTCDGGDGDYDYLEAHAGDGDTQAQYCYSEDNANDGGSAGTGDQCHDG